MSTIKYSENYLRVTYSLLIVTPNILEDYIDRHRGGLICALKNYKETLQDQLKPDQWKQVEDLIAHSENNLCRYYDQIKDNTVLDKSVLDILISKLVMTKEDREEVPKHRKQSDKNKVILDILLRSPKDVWYDFLEALKNSEEETNHKIASLIEQQVMSKETQIGKPLTDIGEYKTKVQKNYNKLVKQIQPLALEGILDKLLEENIVNTDDREEIKSCPSTSEKIRLLLHKINNESRSISFLSAQREDAVYLSLADAIESTQITEEDIQSIKQASTSSEYENRLDVCTMVTVLSVIFKREIPTVTPSSDDITFGADLYRLKSYIEDIVDKDDIDNDTMKKIFPDITEILVRLGSPEIKNVLEKDLRSIDKKLEKTLTRQHDKEKLDKGIPYCLIKDIHDVTVTEGCDAHFEIWTREDDRCAMWSKDGLEIVNSDKFMIRMSGKIHSLNIRNTCLSDKGQYTIRVNDTTRQACLHITEYFTKNPQTLECSEGETVEFLCEVIEDSFSARWSKNGRKLFNGKYKIKQIGKNHALSIMYCEQNDAGNYTVNINNRVRTTTLSVIDKAETNHVFVLPKPLQLNPGENQPNKAGNKNIYIAIHNFQPLEDGDLELQQGKEYEVLDDTRKHWWLAQNKAGVVGYIPANYIQKKFESDLECFDWYYKSYSREKSEEILRKEGKEGCFLVRESSIPGMLALSLYTSKSEDSVAHYLIEKNNEGLFYIGEKHAFPTIQELIYYHKNNKTGFLKRLIRPPSEKVEKTTTATRSSQYELITDYSDEGHFSTVSQGKGGGNIEAVKMPKEDRVDTILQDRFIKELTIMTYVKILVLIVFAYVIYFAYEATL